MLPLLDSQKATRLLAARFSDKLSDGQPLQVVIAASFTAQPLVTSLKLWGRAFNVEIDCRFAEYNQMVQTLLDNDGPFARNRDGVNVILTRPEDFAGDSADRAVDQLDQVLDALEHYAAAGPRLSQLLVGALPPRRVGIWPAG